jgi:hypothetical protein
MIAFGIANRTRSGPWTWSSSWYRDHEEDALRVVCPPNGRESERGQRGKTGVLDVVCVFGDVGCTMSRCVRGEVVGVFSLSPFCVERDARLVTSHAQCRPTSHQHISHQPSAINRHYGTVVSEDLNVELPVARRAEKEKRSCVDRSLARACRMGSNLVQATSDHHDGFL